MMHGWVVEEEWAARLQEEKVRKRKTVRVKKEDRSERTEERLCKVANLTSKN